MSINPDASTFGLCTADLTEMLRAVGVEPAAVGPARTLDDLGLDSLAMMELVARIKDRTGVDLTDDLTVGHTPAEVEALVGSRLGRETA